MKNYNAEVRPRASRRRFAVGLAVLIVGALVVFASSYLDRDFAEWTAAHRGGWIRVVTNRISRFGDWPSHVGLGLALFGIATWRGWEAWRRVALAMVLACAVAGLTARVVKMTVSRPRPSIRNEASWRRSDDAARYHSFPSGHTAVSAAFFGVAALVRPRIGLPLMAIPLLIAVSRIFGLAHYLSDVLGAFLLGFICAWLAVLVVVGERRISTSEPQPN